MPLSFIPLAHPIPDFVPISGNLAQDLDRLAERKRQQYRQGQRLDTWSWEQTLRGIYYHVSRHSHLDSAQRPLERLVLLGSQHSVTQIPIFVTKVVHQYPLLQGIRIDAYLNNPSGLRSLAELVEPLTPQDGFDFENFETLTIAFDNLITDLRKQGVDATDVQIDLTGGQKPTSVVAAAVTFTSDVTNQYVATNPKDWEATKLEYEVLGYDVREMRRVEG